MRSLKLIIICCFYLVFAKSQEVVSVSLKGSRTKQQITSLFSLPLIKYGAKYYQVLYTSTDAKGAKDTLSGLLVVPDNLNNKYPKLIYQHGTSDCKKCVPSNYGTSGGEEGQLGLLFAGLGYVSLLPDYVGMGTGRGFQTYVHDATTISATSDILDAVSSWIGQNNILTNDQLFITGYSQGGYAAMSFHRYMETTKGATSVTAAAHLSGPYSLSGAMRDLILSENEYSYPGENGGETSVIASFYDQIGLVATEVTPLGENRFQVVYTWVALSAPADAPPLLAMTVIEGWDRARVPHPASLINPPATWPIGVPVQETLTIELPADLPSGPYPLAVNWFNYDDLLTLVEAQTNPDHLPVATITLDIP